MTFEHVVIFSPGPLTIVKFPSKGPTWRGHILPGLTKLMRTYDLRQKDISGFETLEPSAELDSAYAGNPSHYEKFALYIWSDETNGFELVPRTSMRSMVENEIARGAAPALRTQEFIRQLVAREDTTPPITEDAPPALKAPHIWSRIQCGGVSWKPETIVMGWKVQLGGIATREERAWLKSRGFSYLPGHGRGAWGRRDA